MKIQISRSTDQNQITPAAIRNRLDAPKSDGADIPNDWRSKVTINHVHYDQKNGAGTTKEGENPLYNGFIGYMKASTFLSLCQMQGANANDRTTKGLKKYIQKGGTIASPSLTYNVQEQQIVGHDGRHRVLAIMDLYGDSLIQVYIKLANGLRGRTVNSDLIDAFNEYCTAENGKTVTGALQSAITSTDGRIDL